MNVLFRSRHGFDCRLFHGLRNRRGVLTQSAVNGPLHPPLVSSTLPDYFEEGLLSRYATRPALICKKESPQFHGGRSSRNLGRADCLAWDFAEFNYHISSMARGLIGLGVKKGDRVGVVMGNNRYGPALTFS